MTSFTTSRLSVKGFSEMWLLLQQADSSRHEQDCDESNGVLGQKRQYGYTTREDA